ncbi:YihY/virulence factor BrkB family protein [Micrococcus luteus]|nr:YihY/virulence factor BrkB family protein [Micrococcus luteus]MCV7575016.1 YihY/virulence factor BrkB family protein [Micrococcus luteus]
MAGSRAAPRRLRTYTRPRVSLLYVLRRTLHRLFELQVWDVAAAMTFFGALSLLPTVIALLSVVSLLGVEEETVDAAAHLAAEIWPSLTPDVVREWILTLGSAGPGTGAVVLGPSAPWCPLRAPSARSTGPCTASTTPARAGPSSTSASWSSSRRSPSCSAPC